MDCYQWLILYLLQETERRQNELVATGADRFTARNESQVYRAAVLSRAYGEYIALHYYWSKIFGAKNNLYATLYRLGSLYGLTCLDKHIVYFYQGGYAKGSEFSQVIKDSILLLCKHLKPDSLSIIDGLAPPDYVINSVLGKSDGKLYENLQTILIHNPGAMSRPEWWYEIVSDAPDLRNLQSKL